MTTRLYKWDDVSAPSHSGTGLGQILNILRACLVTGYGTRTAAGWTNPYLDLPNNVGVFQGLAGTGDLFRIDDNINYEYSKITGFSTMSDVDTGTEEYPKVPDDVSSTNWIQPNRDSSNVSYDPWYVIASEEFCYFISHGASSERACFFFGEYEKITPSATVPNYCISASRGTSVTSTTVGDGVYNLADLYQRRNHWNDVQRNTLLSLRYDVNEFQQPNPLDGKFYFQRVKISNHNNLPYVLWGHMPDLINMYDGGSEDHFSEFSYLTIEGENYLVVKSGFGTIWAHRYDSDVG